MEQEKYEQIAKWCNDGIQLAKQNNISFDDLIKMLKVACGLQTAFDVFWEK